MESVKLDGLDYMKKLEVVEKQDKIVWELSILKKKEDVLSSVLWGP